MVERNWKIIYYEDDKNESEINKFIDGLKPRSKSKVLSWIDILSEKGPNLLRPFADTLEDGVHELRIKLAGNQARILYFFCYKDYIVLTNFFIKKTDKVPAAEILKCKKMRDDFLKRNDEKCTGRIQNENF
jgi:phage-related protein